MLCAITMNHTYGPGNTPVDSLFADYTKFFEGLGCRLHCVPNYTREVQNIFERLPIEGVILSGGNDISAEFAGASGTDIRNPSPERDALENKLLTAAIERYLPVLGICRGMQFINCFFGGSLTQNIETELPTAGNHVRDIHPITIEESSAVTLLGRDTFTVNSYHHQGIQLHQVATELNVFAMHKHDRMVEGIFHPDKPIAGIQWHPERDGNYEEANITLVRAFLARRRYWKRSTR